MSFKNFDNVNPLIAVYENNSRTTSNPISFMLFDTSLHSGSISSDVLTLDYPSTLRGDFYGSTTYSVLSCHCQFRIAGVDQLQTREINAGSTGGNIGGGEVFVANAGANENIQALYRTSGTVNLTTAAKFPRITGVLTL